MRRVQNSSLCRGATRGTARARLLALVKGAVARCLLRTGWRSIAAFCGLLGAFALGSSPAFAISQRGHAFSFAFSGVSSPAGLAVDAATGDLYVADVGHKRVVEYEPVVENGQVVGEKLLRELKGASSAPSAVAVDNSAAGSDPSKGDVYIVDKQHAIEKFNSEGQLIKAIKQFEIGEPKKTKKFAGIEGVAVDPNGNLFVLQASGLIYEFNNSTANEAVAEVSVAGSKLEANPAKVSSGFAVDATGNFYVAGKVFSQYPLQQPLLAELEAEFKVAEAGAETIFPHAAKLDEAGDVLTPALDYEFASAIAVNPSDEPANQVSERDDVYVVDVAGAGTQKVSTVAQFAPSEGEHETGTLIQRFSAPGLTNGEGITVDPKTGTVYVADAAKNKVDVFELEQPGLPVVEGLTATSSTTTEGAETLSANVDPRGLDTSDYFEFGTESCAATLGCEKTAVSEIGHGFSDQHAATQLPSLPSGTYYYRVIAQHAQGKVASAERTFTIDASTGVLPDGRAWEMVSPPDKGGAEPEPIRREGGLVESSASGDAITYTADGPIPANGAVAGNRNPEPTQVLSTADRGPGQEGWATQDITTPAETGAGHSPGTRWEYQIFSSTLALALVDPHVGTNAPYQSPPLSPLLPGEQAGKQENTIFLRDLEPVSPASSEAADFAQARENGQLMLPHNAGYLPLVTQLNAIGAGTEADPDGPGTGFGAPYTEPGIEVEAATPDLSHVVFTSQNHNGHEGIYEWSDGAIQRITVLEDGEELKNATSHEAYTGGSGDVVAARGSVVRHAISANGARVFWTYIDPQTNDHHLEVRETGETGVPQTLQLDTVKGGDGTGPSRSIFQDASDDGSKVFFTDEERLTPDSHAEVNRPDLYVAELGIAGDHLSIKRLKDLTPGTVENADVLLNQREGGGVIGASEDGSYVYFVADGALAPGTTRGRCASEVQTTEGIARPAGTTCNLYVRHYDQATDEWEPPRLVAALSSQDAPDWGGGLPGDYNYMTSRVSPNGRYLAFMSERSLTGYDNEDVSSKSKGERLDEEVFLYDAQQDRVVCASCNPTGARPTGVFDPGGVEGGNGEGIGLVVDRAENWSVVSDNAFKISADHWLAGSIPGWTNESEHNATYQSRYLSDSGRLFFNSADALLPSGSVSGEQRTRSETVEGQEQQVGVENVYEYEPDGIGDCHGGGCVGLLSSGKSEHESAFIDASETGNDVFFLTAAKIASQDSDNNFDIYDARVCGEECPPPPQPPAKACEGEECQGPPSSQGGSLGASGTAAFSGPGNLVAPKQAVLPEKKAVAPAKPLTRAQKLAKALKACRKDRSRGKRLACEKQAKKKYRPPVKKATKSSNTGTGR